MTLVNCPGILTIAGSDSSGGAGIQADIKAISATGSYAASVITALTAQNTQGVQGIQSIPATFISQQLESVFTDLEIHAVKIGMLHAEDVIEAVALALEKFKPAFVVLDPVMVSKSGAVLLESEPLLFLKERLFPLATLITPNRPEAEKILGASITFSEDQEKAAIQIREKYNVSVLVKGGHFSGTQASDVACLTGHSKNHWYHEQRINARHTHGTGCTLSSAIASFLAQGYPIHEAIHYAKTYLTRAIQSAQSLQIGRGCGPVDHFYLLRK